MKRDPYLYQGTDVLRNKLDIRNPDALARAERQIVTQQMRAGVPVGDFDLPHLKAIHRHLFSPIYAWAGEIRTIDMSKDGDRFIPREFIPETMGRVHQGIVQLDYLRGLPRAAFAERAGEIIGDVNYIHPFREGNGRTQLLYLKQLARNAGHAFRLSAIQRDEWLEASRESHTGRWAGLSECISKAMTEKATAIGLDRARDKGHEHER